MLAVVIFLVTLILVIWQPKGLSIGWSAMGGAVVALATGVITWSDIPIVWHIVWDATFTFVALIIISLILDEAGFFHWAALHVARWGGGRGRLLFVLIVLLGACIAAVFANDGAALLLTPIVMAILLRLDFSPTATFAFIIATGFVADTTSLPLMISNLVNIVSANYFNISFSQYATVMVPVDIVALLSTLAVLWLYFRRSLPGSYPTAHLPDPATVIKDHLVFRASFPVLILLLVAYFVTAHWNVPVSVVTGTGALIMLALAGRWLQGGRDAQIPVRKVLRGAPWAIVVFSLGMYLVVYGLRNAGLIHFVTIALHDFASHGPVVAALGTGFMAALLSSIMNNMPAVLVGALAIHHLPATADPMLREIMIYANVIGCDLGPKFTPIGSLATLLWLHVLSRKGVTVGWGQYMKTGLLITPPVLFLTLLMLAWWLPLV
ncbi:arsenic transporter [Acidithiobacillus thiooxidans]|uniref:Arsenical pump membrane protein n=1 Tax=Acidithiobacillus thiooxidans ATCC 19377 TaxID=637390 RepID=A0A543Q484_ACITH|nr:arsenic transporter [Acidithiobacillus thiooxidans]MDR7925485.1 arsenic transporter [Acidithiobacillus thiooxidans]MDX5934740.1 arsenic transporter [Acidithiobacillus thiooxidans]TQN51137.1 Arsenical pump membrane protein [Acidithiobacillus thiooxidans ATCC 19377]